MSARSRAGSQFSDKAGCLYEACLFALFGVLSRPCFVVPVRLTVQQGWHGILWDAMEIFGIRAAHLVQWHCLKQNIEISLHPPLPLVAGWPFRATKCRSSIRTEFGVIFLTRGQEILNPGGGILANTATRPRKPGVFPGFPMKSHSSDSA